MDNKTIIYLIIILILSVLIAWFQYYYKVKNIKNHLLLSILKGLSLFLIGLLFVNPKIKTIITENIKPKLTVLVDDSNSISYFKSEKEVLDIVDKIKNNKGLRDKFELDFFSFGSKIKPLDSLKFKQKNTTIYKALKTIERINRKNNNTTILLTDGNQTIGTDYTFYKSQKPVYPIVIGDTINYEDLKISQLNVNRYSYLKNKFPVEMIVNYKGNKNIKSRVVISKKGKKIFSQNLEFSPDKNTKIISTNLISDEEGLQYYKVAVQQLVNEKNIKNNYKSFSVEVINEQQKVLLLSSILHPDLGMLKKSIEQNKQRKVDLILEQNFTSNINDYQLVIFYQPNKNFKKYFDKITNNFILISGTKTDWNFVNNLNLGFQKKYINQTENYGATYNANFMSFLQKDINFKDFPPLSDRFGTISFTANKQSLLFQKVSGITTEQPLIATFDNTKKYAVIFGEGLWKWRAMNYRQKSDFKDIDAFISNLVQFVSSTTKKQRLELDNKRSYPANENIIMNARYLDKNYLFDDRASLKITLTNLKTKQQKSIPFSLTNNSYQAYINSLESGKYSYKLTVDGQNIQKSGIFVVTEYKIEEQFVSANLSKLKLLAENNRAEVYFKEQLEGLFEKLLADEKLVSIQKINTKKQSIVHWKWILFIIVGLLGIEWFLRKYFGKI